VIDTSVLVLDWIDRRRQSLYRYAASDDPPVLAFGLSIRAVLKATTSDATGRIRLTTGASID
jgi:hypothetical protein